MSQGKAVVIKRGRKHPHRLYIKLKGGAVYVWPTLLTTWNQGKLRESIEKNGGICQLKYWIKVR